MKRIASSSSLLFATNQLPFRELFESLMHFEVTTLPYLCTPLWNLPGIFLVSAWRIGLSHKLLRAMYHAKHFYHDNSIDDAGTIGYINTGHWVEKEIRNSSGCFEFYHAGTSFLRSMNTNGCGLFYFWCWIYSERTSVSWKLWVGKLLVDLDIDIGAVHKRTYNLGTIGLAKNSKRMRLRNIIKYRITLRLTM